MSGLFGALGNSVKALNAQSRSLETAGKNLANVNNESYARQRVVLGDRGTVMTSLGAQSLGLEAKSIQQLRDELLDRQVVRESSLQSTYEAEQAAYTKAQAGLGQSVDSSGAANTSAYSGSGSGIAEALDNLFSSFSSLAARPTDPGQKETLVQNAGILVDRLQTTDTRLDQLQTDLTNQTQSDIDDANKLLQNIADLNTEIGRFEIANPGSAVDLRDQRQAQVELLAKKISIETQPNSSNPSQIDVFVRDGSGNPITLVTQTTVTGLTLSGSTVSGGSPSTAVVLKGGSILGNLTARDTGVKDLRDNLDALAKQLVVSVNAAYNPTSISGEDFFDSANQTAGTISLRTGLAASNIRSSNGAAGDNAIAQAVADLANKNFSTASGDAIDGTFSQSFSTTVSRIGQSLASANLQVTDQTNIATLVKSQRDGVSGVSMDEELADMMKFQRAFQASSRVVQVMSELLQDVVNLGR
ncbi:MAG TPA: flagellar hook-associated protein FlgK [Opitutaceae bacterium]|nr:flagellar hook-associated protein FlgK [Opitutaceae bacterium]